MEWKNSVPHHTCQQETKTTPEGQTSNFANDSALQVPEVLTVQLSQKFSRTNTDIDTPLL